MFTEIDQITTFISLIGQLKDAYKKADQAQIKSILADFQEMATDAKLAAISVKEENVKLREELLKLKEKISNKSELLQKPNNGLYYYSDNPNRLICSRCHETKNLQVTVQKREYRLGSSNYLTGEDNTYLVTDLECPECKTIFEP